jgi:hypothetical protein
MTRAWWHAALALPVVFGTQTLATTAQVPRTACDAGWVAVKTDPISMATFSTAVSAASTDDAWLVGSGYLGVRQIQVTEHWDGTGWSLVPNAGSTGLFWAVDDLSSTDAWAAGATGLPDTGEAIAEHWDGARWSVAHLPDVGTEYSILRGIDGPSSNDMWVVGEYADVGGTGNRTLTEHWNGSRWRLVPSPSLDVDAQHLQSVSAVGSADAWAVGYTYDQGDYRTLIVHWDGRRWRVVDAPTPGVGGYLKGVVGVTPDDVWAVGTYWPDFVGDDTQLILHWDGTGWTAVPAPGVGWLASVSAAAPDDVWAAGGYWNGHNTMLHWDGSTWSDVPVPQPSDADYLTSVSVLPGGGGWASGITIRKGKVVPGTLRCG